MSIDEIKDGLCKGYHWPPAIVGTPKQNKDGTVSWTYEAYGDDVDGKELVANARLIAAAPDLLAACKTAVHFLRVIHVDDNWQNTKLEHIYYKARAAIAKAEGGEK